LVCEGLERLLAFAILIGIIAFAFKSVVALIGMDWSSTETFYELIYRVLLLVIGVELIRTLVTHDLTAVLELLAFVVARKMLKPELATIDILLGVGAFCGPAGCTSILPGAAHQRTDTPGRNQPDPVTTLGRR
jgi:hypothetical protein